MAFKIVQNLTKKQLGPIMLGVIKKFRRRVPFDNFAEVHKKHPVGNALLANPISWETTIIVMPSCARLIMTSSASLTISGSSFARKN